MYKKSLFSQGVKSFIPYKLGYSHKKKPSSFGLAKQQSYGGSGVFPSTSLDDELLSLVRGIGKMGKPMKRGKTCGSGLKFIR